MSITTKYKWWADFLLPTGRVARSYNPEFFDTEREAQDSLRSSAHFHHEYGGEILMKHAVEPVYCNANSNYDRNLRA